MHWWAGPPTTCLYLIARYCSLFSRDASFITALCCTLEHRSAAQESLSQHSHLAQAHMELPSRLVARFFDCGKDESARQWRGGVPIHRASCCDKAPNNDDCSPQHRLQHCLPVVKKVHEVRAKAGLHSIESPTCMLHRWQGAANARYFQGNRPGSALLARVHVRGVVPP